MKVPKLKSSQITTCCQIIIEILLVDILILQLCQRNYLSNNF